MPVAQDARRRRRGRSARDARCAAGTSACDVGARLRGRVVDVEGPRAGEQLEGDDGERVAVARGGRGEAAGLLGRDVGGGAEDLAGLGDRRLAGDGRDPEVADREAAVVVEQEVAGLDVAVDDVVAVRAVERDRRLAQPAQRDRAREPAALAQPVGDGPAGEVLHDHEGAVVVLADVVDGHDVAAVAEPGGGARLAQEPAPRALVGVVGAREDLDRDEAPEELVLGGPDRGHAPVGDMPQHAIPGRERDPLLGCRHRAHATRAESGSTLQPPHGQGLSQLREGSRLRKQSEPLDGRDQAAGSTRTCRRSGSSSARRRSASTSAPAASRPARSPRPSSAGAPVAPSEPCRRRAPSPASSASAPSVEGALAHLESRRAEINDLNVFPVADGDTGDNMALTLRAVPRRARPPRPAEDAHRSTRSGATRSSTRSPARRCSARAATAA